jgi:hypothetical protein
MKTVVHISIAITSVSNVRPAQTASVSTGQMELQNPAPSLFGSVDHACLGEFYADNTICKYFNANFIVLFHVFLFLETVHPG